MLASCSHDLGRKQNRVTFSSLFDSVWRSCPVCVAEKCHGWYTIAALNSNITCFFPHNVGSNDLFLPEHFKLKTQIVIFLSCGFFCPTTPLFIFSPRSYSKFCGVSTISLQIWFSFSERLLCQEDTVVSGVFCDHHLFQSLCFETCNAHMCITTN